MRKSVEKMENARVEEARKFGALDSEGFEVLRSDFRDDRDREWVRGWEAGTLVMSVNVDGRGSLEGWEMREWALPGTVAVFSAHAQASGIREAAEKHRFVMLGMTRRWFLEELGGVVDCFGEAVLAFARKASAIRPILIPLRSEVRKVTEEMWNPPVSAPLLKVWFNAKIVEIAAHVLSVHEGGFFCERQRRLARERVEAVKAILLRDLEHPPTLEAIAREVGCSPFYLSRIFSEETGGTMTRYLRAMRLDLAAERLKSGKYNVTEAAMSVGYSSLSHFSKAFAERYGHCPCVFPLQKPSPLARQERPVSRRKGA